MDTVSGDRVGKLAQGALDAGGGVLRLAPTWVPRSFLQPSVKMTLKDNGASGVIVAQGRGSVANLQQT